jgi:hypothetical protein
MEGNYTITMRQDPYDPEYLEVEWDLPFDFTPENFRKLDPDIQAAMRRAFIQVMTQSD